MPGNYNDFDRELAINPSARVPVCLCLDTSASMSVNFRIDELNAGVRRFYTSVRNDEAAYSSADIAIVSFGWNGVQCIQKFASLEKVSVPPTLKADGMTPMGEAVNLSLDLLEARKNAYKKVGVDYYQPWLVLMTDGVPNGNIREQLRACGRIRELCDERKLVVFAIGIGNDADMKVLSEFSPKRPPLRLKGLEFQKFFQWLSSSLSRVSVSQVGEEVKLDLKGIEKWGTL